MAGCMPSLPKPTILGGIDQKCPAVKPPGLPCAECEAIPEEIPTQLEDVQKDYLAQRQALIECARRNSCNIARERTWDQSWEGC